MRKRVNQSGVVINAVAGNHVVMLGLDIAGKLRKGLRGFAIRRTDHEAEEVYWMRGMKTFASVEPNPVPGEQFSSREHPLQSFQWSDYSAKPDHEYTYEVITLYGKPSAMEERNSASVTIRTEPIVAPITPSSSTAVRLDRGDTRGDFRTRRPTRPDRAPTTGCRVGLRKASAISSHAPRTRAGN